LSDKERRGKPSWPTSTIKRKAILNLKEDFLVSGSDGRGISRKRSRSRGVLGGKRKKRRESI